MENKRRNVDDNSLSRHLDKIASPVLIAGNLFSATSLVNLGFFTLDRRGSAGSSRSILRARWVFVFNCTIFYAYALQLV